MLLQYSLGWELTRCVLTGLQQQMSAKTGTATVCGQQLVMGSSGGCPSRL